MTQYGRHPKISVIVTLGVGGQGFEPGHRLWPQSLMPKPMSTLYITEMIMFFRYVNGNVQYLLGGTSNWN